MIWAVLWIRNAFCLDPDPTCKLVSDSDPKPVSDPTRIFSNILDIHFIFVFPSCNCVRLHIMARYKLFREIFFVKKEFLFLN